MAASDSTVTPVLPPRPEMPRPEDCCGSGCVHCVYVLYDIALTKWEREVERIVADAAKTGESATNLRASAAAS
jgi:hypothetical protein